MNGWHMHCIDEMLIRHILDYISNYFEHSIAMICCFIQIMNVSTLPAPTYTGFLDLVIISNRLNLKFIIQPVLFGHFDFCRWHL